MKLLLAALFLTAASLADPVAITWNGPVVVESLTCGGCPYGAYAPEVTPTLDGLNADLSVSFGSSAYGYGPSEGIEIQIPFEVTGDAAVAITGTAGFGAYGSSAPAYGGTDLTSWNFSGGFAGAVSVVGADSIGFAGTQTVESDDCTYGDCVASVGSDQPVAGELNLSAGTYTLDIQESYWDNSIGDSMAGAGVTLVLSDPTPNAVPEPHLITVYDGGILLLLLLWLAFRRQGQ